jgi:hypothetical protein
MVDILISLNRADVLHVEDAVGKPGSAQSNGSLPIAVGPARAGPFPAAIVEDAVLAEVIDGDGRIGRSMLFEASIVALTHS